MSLGVCSDCGYIGIIENHHVIPRVMGGTFTVPLCVKCHGLVHGRDFVKSRNLHKIGVEKAKAEGRYKGRPKGTKESFEDFLKKKVVKDICVYRATTMFSFRMIASAVGCSIGTVQKHYKLISDEVAYAIAKDQLTDVNILSEVEIKIKRLEKKILDLRSKVK